MRQLRQELASQESHLRARADLLSQSRQYKRRESRHVVLGKKVARRRKGLLRKFQALDEEELRRRAAQQAKVHQLRADREKIDREIAAALAGRYTEEEVRRQLDGLPDEPGALDNRWAELAAKLQGREGTLRDRLERRGQLSQQLQSLADDRRLGLKRLELGDIEQRLERSRREWQVLAVTSQVLETVRQSYERDRQPETLREASQYLNQMTMGRYTRVWTPLDDNLLLVDDQEGKPLRVEVLSRGTREQLFLSLRMALVTNYARRHVDLPLVLDDVFVNFDSLRSKATAALLRDFALQGHQLLVFTCHEHIARMFKSLRVPVRELPVRGETVVPASLPRRAEPLQVVELELPVLPVIEIEVQPAPQSPVIERIPVAREIPDLPPAPMIVAETVPLETRVLPVVEFAAEALVAWTGPAVPVVSASSVYAESVPWDIELPPPPSPPQPVAVTWVEPAPPPPVPVFMPPVPVLLPPPAAQPAIPVIRIATPPVEPIRNHVVRVEPVRVDPPRRRLERFTPFRRRWEAEEFSGELSDRVFQE